MDAPPVQVASQPPCIIGSTGPCRSPRIPHISPTITISHVEIMSYLCHIRNGIFGVLHIALHPVILSATAYSAKRNSRGNNGWWACPILVKQGFNDFILCIYTFSRSYCGSAPIEATYYRPNKSKQLRLISNIHFEREYTTVTR